MEIKYVSLHKDFNHPSILSAVKETLESGQYVLGKKVEEFEQRFSALCGTKYAVAVNSGTDALFLSLKVLQIGNGHQIITVPNTFVATVGAIAAAGATPVFVDVGDDYNIDPELIEKAITKNTKAIMPVHLTGNISDMDKINAIAQKHSLAVIEDACQAVGSSLKGRNAGQWGNFGCFSLHPLKNLNVCGDGGIITTDNKEHYHQLLQLRNHGLCSRDEVAFYAYNSRLDALQAAIGLVRMEKMTDVIDKRKKNAHLYDHQLKNLAPNIVFPPTNSDKKAVYSIYMVKAKQRDNLHNYLESKGIEVKIHYPIPLHLQKASKDLGYKLGDFPLCEQQSKSIISFPCHHHLQEVEIKYITNHIIDFYQKQ